jgi:hypothetical protein
MKLLPLLIAVSLVHAASASEEEFLRPTRLEFQGSIGEKSQVKLVVESTDTGMKSVVMEAHGRTITLTEDDLVRLTGFHAATAIITHEAGYPQLGGHTIHFKLSDEGTEKVTISVPKDARYTIKKEAAK